MFTELCSYLSIVFFSHAPAAAPPAPLSTIASSTGLGRRTASVGSSTSATSSRGSTATHPRGGNIDRHITAAHVNINSITARCRLDELSLFASINDIDILCLSETKLDNSVHPSLFTLDNFHDPLTRHRDRNGGGVAIYVRNNLAVKRLTNLEIGEIEWVWCLVKIKRSTIIICTLYLPPNLSSVQHATFFEKLNESFALAQAFSPDNILILGDFNAGNTFLSPDFPCHSPISSYEICLQEEFAALNFTQLINQPTRYSESSRTTNLRDLIFVSNELMIKSSGVLSSFSNIDHLPIFASLKIECPSSTPNHSAYLWDYRRMDADKLTRLLMDTDWDSILDCDLDEATNNFTKALIVAAQASIPIRTISSKADNKPWFTAELKREIRKRERLYKIAKRRNTDYDWERWRRQRNITTDTNKRLKDQYIQSQVAKLLAHKKDPRSYHHILKNIMGKSVARRMPPLIAHDGTPITDEYDKATILNDYFASQTRLETHGRQVPTIMPPFPPIAALSEVRVTEPEVLKILNGLDINKSSGSDDIPNKLLKICALLIASPLTKLFNKSLQLGRFPLSWKKACVTPIFKQKGSSSDPTNYRPISLLPNLSKVLEKLVFNKIYAHLTNNNLLTEKQSGYRPGHSTQIQLLYLSHQLYSALNEGQNFTAVFLDISKYFDKIWHHGLITKCKIQYNITGPLLEWLESYLKDRTQIVRVGNSFSASQNIQSGCPQGSVLGPLLALIYLNDLSHKTENDALFFADDTSLYSTHPPDDHDHRQSLQNDLDAIKQFGTDWAITFNAQKTIQQTFTNKRDNLDLALSFDNQDIPTVTSHKHLGLTLSKDLHFHEHVNNIVRTINTFLGPIYPVAKFLSRPVLNDIYTTYIRPHFDYCDIIYDGHLTSTDAARLQTLQNRCARLVTGALFRTSTAALLNDLGWERLETRRLIHKLLFFHRLFYNNPPLPSYITDILTDSRQDATGLTLRNADSLSIPPIHLASFYRSYIPASIRQWNLLPESLRSTTSRSDFAHQVWQRLGAPAPPTMNSFGTKSLNTHHTRLRVGLSTLNAHLFRIQHKNTQSPACACGYQNEDTNHYLLWCPLYDNNRKQLFGAVQSILPNFSSFSSKSKLRMLLYGENLNERQKIFVVHHLQTFIFLSRRFIATP